MVPSFFDGEELNILRLVQAALPPDAEVYLVGGAVRDLVLKRPVHDFDFVLAGGARKIGQRIANALNGAFMMLDEEREVSRVILPDMKGGRVFLDFSIFRAGSLADDLLARDFTINAMAVSLRDPERIIDPTGGLDDLRTKQLEICSPESLNQDPLRVVRAVRMAVEFKLRMTAETISAIKKAVPKLRNVSPERLRDELFKILECRRVSTSLRLMDQFGILKAITPEMEEIKGMEQSLPHEMDVWHHTLAVEDALERLIELLTHAYSEDKGENLTFGLAVLKLGRFRAELKEHFSRSLHPERARKGLLLFGGLFHDVGKGSTLTIDAAGKRHFYTHEVIGQEKVAGRAAALMLSNVEIDYLKGLIKNHMRLHLLSKESGSASHRAIYRFFRDCGDSGIDVCLLSLADILSRRSGAPEFTRWERELNISEQLMDSFWHHTEERVNPLRLINGDEVMRLYGLTPGKIVGEILEAVREAQACGEIADRNEALGFIASWLKERAAEEEKSGGR
jgi:tRNA nucleotidyltransferase/poly(A) polymerase